jgi:hypothetical protein
MLAVDVALAARNMVADTPDQITDPIGSDNLWGPWVFEGRPLVPIENTQKALIVITHGDGWDTPNSHNTMEFPRLTVDVWADPTRNPDLSVQTPDAKDKIITVFRRLDKVLHLIDRGNGGRAIWWGTADEIDSRSGIRIIGSIRLTEPEFFPIQDVDHGWMGRVEYGVTI